MALGSIRIRVRPIRVAFLVNPADRVGLYNAIELSTLLWGGSFNPIIPVYNRTPAKWDAHRIRYLPSPNDVIEGYLNGFDPDIVVPVGTCFGRTFQVGNRDIVSADELIGDFKESASPNYGVGIIDLLNDLIEKEFKYKRYDDFRIVFPKLPRAYSLFLASVFGVLPETCQRIIDKNYTGIPGITETRLSLQEYVKLIRSGTFFPRRLTAWALENRSLRDAQLFVCDARSTQDIIDYWNLRAAGYYVIPIPIQAAKTEDVMEFARDFIEKNYQPYSHNPNIFNHTTIQRSRSLNEETVKGFCESLGIINSKDNSKPKYIYRFWYPRLWDSWAREHASEGIIFPYSHEEERRIPDGETDLDLRTVDPKFELQDGYSGRPKFANEFNFRFYGYQEPMAEVFPEGSRELSSAIGRAGYHNWRFSKSGPVFLAHDKEDLIFIELPRAESVMTQWFGERGWKVSLSGPGRIATQLIKQLGGVFGITWLAHRGVIDLLSELEKEAGMPRQAVIQRLKHVIVEDELHFKPERFLEKLLESNAIRLGGKVQCPVCTRYNWYELNTLEYKLVCRFCLSDFQPPLESPKNIEWTYRAHGPFASSIAQGSFTVLLALKFLDGDHRCGITPIFSYIAKSNNETLEADFSCLYKYAKWEESHTHIVHAECKSFNRFERSDVNRMKILAKAFPGAALVFATLNDSLQQSEIKMLSLLVQSERKKRLRGKPFSPVIILTGIELFSSRGFRDCWEDRGGLYEKFHGRRFDYYELPALADATQQLYLNLPSWHDWSEAEWKKKIKML